MIHDESDARTLLQRMSQQEEPQDLENLVLEDHQVAAIVEIVAFRLLSESPGMKNSVTCEMERVPDGWTLHVRRKKP